MSHVGVRWLESCGQQAVSCLLALQAAPAEIADEKMGVEPAQGSATQATALELTPSESDAGRENRTKRQFGLVWEYRTGSAGTLAKPKPPVPALATQRVAPTTGRALVTHGASPPGTTERPDGGQEKPTPFTPYYADRLVGGS